MCASTTAEDMGIYAASLAKSECAPASDGSFSGDERESVVLEESTSVSSLPAPVSNRAAPRKRSRKKKVKDASRTPRPPNAWILYRSEKIQSLDVDIAQQPQSEISKLIGKMWREESVGVKQAFAQQAELRKQEHREKYPDYRYAPSKKKQQSASTATVTSALPSQLDPPIPRPTPQRASTVPSNSVSMASQHRSMTPSGLSLTSAAGPSDRTGFFIPPYHPSVAPAALSLAASAETSRSWTAYTESKPIEWPFPSPAQLTMPHSAPADINYFAHGAHEEDPFNFLEIPDGYTDDDDQKPSPSASESIGDEAMRSPAYNSIPFPLTPLYNISSQPEVWPSPEPSDYITQDSTSDELLNSYEMEGAWDSFPQDHHLNPAYTEQNSYSFPTRTGTQDPLPQI